jgi:hypothetical protein
MGKLLSGRYGHSPEAESIPLTLQECHQKLNLRPSDFVSMGSPAFFRKSFGSHGKYLLFQVEPDELQDSVVWKAGYYLLPIDAAAVLEALEKHKRKSGLEGDVLPIEWEEISQAPLAIQQRAIRWAQGCQPRFFKCNCRSLLLRLYAPWAMRRRWKARLRCPNRCQPALVTPL